MATDANDIPIIQTITRTINETRMSTHLFKAEVILSMIGYYYCSYEVFTSMLESKSIWLTNLTQSNDSQEVTQLYNNIWDDIKNRLKKSDLDQNTVDLIITQFENARIPQLHFDVPFGCCMSYENDLVQQWREYGDKGKGLSIGFDLEWFNIKRQYPCTSASVNASIGYEAIIYDSQQLRNSLYTQCYNAIKAEDKNAWVLSILPTFKHYAGFIKNHTFRDEREIRILFYPTEYIEDSLVGLSGLKNNIKAHYCLDWANTESNAMRSITLGYECEKSPDEIVKLVENAGLAYMDQVVVTESACSYQDRKQ